MKTLVGLAVALALAVAAGIAGPGAAAGQFGGFGGQAKAEVKADQPKGQPSGRVRETEADFAVWRRKAQLELESLEAQIAAKRAEIARAEAEFRLRQLAPTLTILAKLDQPIPIQFPDETPLEDVLKYIKQATAGPDDAGIPIYVDPDGLRRAEKTMQSPVALDLEGVPLRTTLRLILKQLGLRYSVRDGLLMITAEEQGGGGLQ